MSNLSLREIAQSQLDSTPVIDGQLIVCLDTGNAYRDTATAHVKIGSDLEVVSDLPLAPLAEKLYYLKPDKLYVFLGGNWTLLNDKTIDLDESIAKLPAGSSTVLNDDVEIITQDTDITQPHYYRRKLVVLWEYIKTKAQDFFAAKNHQHEKADITDFPTSMPASDVYPWAKAATKPSYTKAEIGLGKVDNTADADKTVKRATTAGTADSANSVAWGNVRDKPTTFPVEAHTHDDRYYTEAEVNSKLSGKVDNTEAGANGLINKLSTADGIPNDATVFISQHNDGKTASYYRRPISTLWTYIKSKADSVYQPKGSYAASNHTHDDRYYTEAEMDGRLNSKVDNNEAGANGLLSKLSVWTATPTDDTYFMRQDTDGTNQFGRVKFSTIWNYIRGKADSVYLKLSGGTVTGNTAITGSYLQVPMITGETSHDIRGTAQIKKAHGIQLGIPSRDYCNFYEYGGVWNFYKTKDSYMQESGDGVLIAKIDTNGVHANLIGTADNALKLGGLFPSTDGTSSTWGTIPTVATTGVTELGKYVDFHADNSGDVDYDIRLTANKGSLEVAGGPIIGSLLGNATTAGTANSLSGLSSRSSQGWGVQTGTFVHGECDSTGGDFAFRRDCPTGGQLSMILDGRFYQNEGKYRVLDTSDEPNLNVRSASAANSLNPTVTFTGGNGNTTGYRLIGQVTFGKWSNYRCVMIVKSRHQGAGIVSVCMGNNTSTISQANAYSEIKYWGPQNSGTVIYGDAYKVYISADGKTGYLFWQYSDYSNTEAYVISSDFTISNGTWMTSIGSGYGSLWSTTQVNVANRTTYVKDIGNSSDTTFAYSKAGMNYVDYTWLAGWNGYELRAVNKNQFAIAGHSHSFINSVGVKNAQTGRNQIYGNVYSYNSNASAHTGMPTTYTSTIGFGQGAFGTVEICGEWTGGKGLWSRALRDCCDNWYDWQRIYTDNYHPNADYATKANSADNASTSNGVKDYNDGNRTIKIGYAGSGLTADNLTHIAGYTDNGTKLKDVNKDVLKSWIGKVASATSADNGVTASGKTGAGIYYVRFGNGTQMCWGFYKESDHSGSTSFPVAFNNSQYSISLTVTVSSNNAPYITGRSTTGFSYARHGSSYNDIQWIAVGTWK